MKTTIKDVAKKSGVSISTVSRVLNNPLAVREDKRIKVQKVIKEMNYSPNSLARGLISKKTNTIGVFIPDISNQFTASLVKGIEDKGNELGYNMILCDTGHDKERVLNYLKVLIEKQVDGVIFSSQYLEEEYYKLLNHYNIPIVLAATESFDFSIPSVKVDDARAAYTATEFLINKNHKKLVMISGPKEDKIAGIPRLKGFKKAHKDLLGTTVDSSQIAYSNFLYDSAYEAMQKLYSDNKGEIDAVFCASDEIAASAISFLNTVSLRVPEDISVMGFDDTPLARMFVPKITTLKQPIYEIGLMSVEKLDASIKSESTDSANQVRIYMPHEVVVRDSVKLNRK